MGNQYFMSIYYNYRGEILLDDSRKDLTISGEELGMGVSDRRVLQVLSSRAGVFFYETDLWDRDELKKRLHALVEEIGSVNETSFRQNSNKNDQRLSRPLRSNTREGEHA